jgi:hypothetical protein
MMLIRIRNVIPPKGQKEIVMKKNFSDENCYAPRGCEFEEEPDCICESIPVVLYDPVVKTFAEILMDGSERAVMEYDDLPENLTVSIVFNFPNIGVRRAMIYSLDEWSAHLLSEYARELAETEIELPRPRVVTGNLIHRDHHKKTNCSINEEVGGY